MSRPASIALVALSLAASAVAQSPTEPDLVISALTDTLKWGAVNGIHAYSVGTVVTNAGTAGVAWNAGTNAHPVIAQNLYRLRNGRLEHIGMSWVANPGALAQGTVLSPGSTFSSSASANGSQAQLGPRLEVDPLTGSFAYPPAVSYPAPSSVIDRRLQVQSIDVNPAALLNQGAQYFVEAQVIHPDDATSGANLNNASYRPVTINPTTHEMAFSGPTVAMKSAIWAWKDVDPDVQIVNVDVPGDGRLLVAFRGTPEPYSPAVNGVFHYEIAIQNLSCQRGVESVSLELMPYGLSPGNTFCGTAMPFIAPPTAPYHSGELIGEGQWHRTVTALPGNCGGCGVGPGPTPFQNAVIWAPPVPADPYARILRWGSLFNLSVENVSQLPGRLALKLAGPQAPSTIMIGPFDPPRRPFVRYHTYTSLNANVEYVDISTTGWPGPVGDDNSFAVPIGFPFPFYTGVYTHAVISTNGYLTFAGQSGNVALNTPLPSPASPNGIIAAYWDDLDCPSVFDIRYKTVNGRFVVCWDCTHAGDPQPLKFEVILEPDGDIITAILQCPFNIAGGSATIGIEGPSGTEAVQTLYNTASVYGGQCFVYSRNSLSTNLFATGHLGGGFFTLTYVGPPNSQVFTVATAQFGMTPLGELGTLPFVLANAVGISDYLGVFTGVPDPTAVTNANGVHEMTIWVQPGLLPPGFGICFGGISIPPDPADTYNNWFNISNGTSAGS